MRKINICIIGYGSIGSRHAKVLSTFKSVGKIYVLTKRVIPKKFQKIYNIRDIVEKKIDYIIISNKTSDHFLTLKKIDKIISKKIILVEKPLFDKYRKFKSRNKIYVGYNMRFNPILLKLKSLIRNKKLWSINLICSSFLPFWRNNRNYTKIYSSSKRHGGGVLLDLSHEIDYLQWVFGKISIDNVFNKKISNLKISSDDYLSMQGMINKKTRFNLELNYFSKFPIRRMLVDGNNISLEVNLIKKEILLNQKDKQKKLKTPRFSRDFSYKKMHQAILNKKKKNLCSLEQGQRIMKLIDHIRKL